jgi:hypothetical protein
LWVFDQKVNDCGFYTDGALIETATNAAEMGEEAAQFRELTGINPTQVEKFKHWLAERGHNFRNLNKKTVGHTLKSGNLPPATRQALQLRLDSAQTAGARGVAYGRWAGPRDAPVPRRLDGAMVGARTAAAELAPRR